MTEEEIVNEFKSIINSIYLQGFIKDNNGEISTLLKNLLDLYNKEKDNKQLDILVKEKSKDIGYMVLNYISKDKIRELRQKLSIIADNEYNKYKKSTTTFVNICGICADIDDLLEK